MKRTILLLLLFVSKIVLSCDCPPLEPISVKGTEKYDVIFFGTVDSVEACLNDVTIVHFTVSELYKGVAESHMAVYFDCKSNCSMSFAKGEQWIIYSIYRKFNEPVVDMCFHSRKYFSDPQKDYYTAAAGKTFEEEKKYLLAELGDQPIIRRNKLNEQQKEFKPRNQLPSGYTVLILLGISVLAMVVVYWIAKKYFKNGK